MTTVHKRMQPWLGTYVEIGVHGASPACTERALQSAFAAVRDVHERLSFQDPDSDLSRLNRAGAEGVTLHPLSCRVLRLACAMMRASGGLFDCTVGGALVQSGTLPDHGGPCLPRGTVDDVEWQGARVRLRRPVRLTLDGIAKGYAIDCAVRALQRCGMTAGWVNAGGDLRAWGDCVLPVSRRDADGQVRALGGLQGMAMASSGHAARRDARFPALLVATGEHAVLPGVWTVLARTAWRADALTKVAAQLPEARRATQIAALGGRWLP